MGFPRASSGRLYHGSKARLQTLRPNTYVTPYPEDALVFAVPWDSRELVSAKGPGQGRPPQKLEFKPGRRIPPDHPIYLYEVDTPTVPALTNTGRNYPWNRATTEETKPKLVKVVPSWQAYLLEDPSMNVSNSDMKRAFHLLAGPGFGQRGMSIKEAVTHLVSEGMSPQKAFLTVQAGAQLARKEKIPVRKQAALKGKLVRLAHANPGPLQKVILPLLEK